MCIGRCRDQSHVVGTSRTPERRGNTKYGKQRLRCSRTERCISHCQELHQGENLHLHQNRGGALLSDSLLPLVLLSVVYFHGA